MAAGLAATAAVIHAVEAPRHLVEWWGYGLFFVITAVAQAALAVLLLRPPRRAEGWIARAGIAGNLAIAGLYLLTRTVGIPLVGPGAGEVESLDRSGLVATLTELLLVIALALRHRTLGASAGAVARRWAQRAGRAPRPGAAVHRTARLHS